MSDRTMLALGDTGLSVPRLVKRAVQVGVVTALTAAAAFIVLVSSNLLMARGTSAQGIAIWLGFIKRSDIFGTMLLTAIVAIAYQAWERGRERR